MSKENVLDLFHASNEEALDVTLGEILPEVVKQNSKSPKSVKFPSKVKKLANNNSYKITSLGREFLKLTEPISK